MADLKSIGEGPEFCPVCQTTKLHDISDPKLGYAELGCSKCGRVWVYVSGGWVSKARKVIIKREPRVGDSPDDFLEVVKD